MRTSLNSRYRKHGTKTSCAYIPFCMALSGALLLPSMDAAALDGFANTNVGVSTGDYRYDIYEWRYDIANRGTLPRGCATSTAPLVVLFHGGEGMDDGNKVINTQMTGLARRLATACVRMMTIQGKTAITTNLAKDDFAIHFTDQLSNRMLGALSKAVSIYPSTTNVVLFSGSFGGVTAAALMANNRSYFVDDNQAGWNRLDRFVLNVPAGSVKDTCLLNPPVPFVYAYTNLDCAQMKQKPATNGWVVRPFFSSELYTLAKKTEIHLFVGSNDPILGSGNAVWGMNNYVSTAGINTYTWRFNWPDNGTIPPLPTRSARITATVVEGAVHDNIWNYNSQTVSGLCQIMARSFRNAGSTTDDRDTRNMTDAKLIEACK